VHTASVHCAGNYFSKKEASDLDLEIPEGAEDGGYVATLEGALPDLFAATRPQLVFFQACLCVCVCMHICIYTCMCVCVCVCVCVYRVRVKG